MAAWDIVVHQHGRGKGVCIETVAGTKADAQKAAKAAAGVWFPNLATAWSGSGKTALLVKREGDVLATIAIEPAEGK